MGMLVRLAWRNIARNKRRTAITIVTVTFATLLSISMRGLQIGTYRANIRNAVELFSGYLQIQHPDYRDNPSLRHSIRPIPEMIAALEDRREVTGHSPRIYTEGLVSFRERSLGAALFGIDPARERKITTLHERLDQGRFLSSSSAMEVVVGAKLLDNLGAAPGDSVVVLSQAYDGTLGNLFFTIVGTIKTGSPDLDRKGLFMGLDAAQELLGMDDRVTLVAVSLDKVENVGEVEGALDRRLKPLGLECLPWNEIMPELEQSIQLDNISGILMLGILVVVAAFGILNTMLMSITERFNEFGVLLAVGMPNRKLCTVVLMETVFIVLMGLLAGNLIAAGVNAHIVDNPIEITGKLDAMYEQFGFIPRMESTLSPGVFVKPSLAIFLVSLLAFLYPGWKTFRLGAMKGIRYT